MVKLSEILNWIREEIMKLKADPKLLWTGAHYMTEIQKITFKEKVSEQRTGIVLMFSVYSDGVAQSWGYQSFFVPKTLIVNDPGRGHTFQLTTGTFGHIGTKYLYINDTGIAGHADNIKSGVANKVDSTAGSGIKYQNNYFVLRNVYGV